MAYIMAWDPLERFFVGLTIGVLLYCGILYSNRGRKREDHKEKVVMFGFAGFFLCFALGRFSYFLAYLTREGVYLDGIFFINSDTSNIYYELLDALGSTVGLIGFFILFLSFEIATRRSKYILSIFQIVSIIIVMLVPYPLYVVLLAIFIIVDIIVIVFILLFFTKWAGYEFRAISSIILFGMNLIFTGVVLNHSELIKFGLLPLSVSPLLILAGSLIMISPMLIDIKYFSKASTYWLVLGILTLGITIFLLILTVIIGVAVYVVIILSIFIISLGFSLYFTMKLLNKEEVSDKKISQDYLSAFSRRQNLTEEEVSISKEKKICLVCKTNVSKQIFLCSDCGAFYCTKCSEALSDLENACWVCNTPFDDSKPTKSFELEEKEIDVEVSEKALKKD